MTPTPHEKAKELIDKFSPYVRSGERNSPSVIRKYAKQCALICVEEILSLRMIDVMGRGGVGLFDNEANFWTEVKNELLKM